MSDLASSVKEAAQQGLQSVTDKAQEASQNAADAVTDKAQEVKKDLTQASQNAADATRQELQLAGNLELVVDQPVKGAACYANFVSLKAANAGILQLQSYRDGQKETFPSVFVRAQSSAANVSELVGQTLGAQVFVQPQANGPIWSTGSELVQLKVPRAPISRPTWLFRFCRQIRLCILRHLRRQSSPTFRAERQSRFIVRDLPSDVKVGHLRPVASLDRL